MPYSWVSKVLRLRGAEIAISREEPIGISHELYPSVIVLAAFRGGRIEVEPKLLVITRNKLWEQLNASFASI